AELTGKILVSVDDKNWEATRELWKIKEEIKRDPQLLAIFKESPSVPQLVAALQQVPAGQRVLQSVDRYKKEYGYKAVYSHEYIYRLWVEDPTPIFELLRGYVASDYDFEQDLRRVREERDAAIAALRDRITDPEAR